MKNEKSSITTVNSGIWAFQFKEYSDTELIVFVQKALKRRKLADADLKESIPGIAGKYRQFLAGL